MKHLFLKKLARDESGAAVIDAAFTLPVLIIATVMILDIGRAMFLYSSLQSAAADTVRYASVRGLESGQQTNVSALTDYAKERATGLPGADLNVNVVWVPSDVSGGTITVTLTYTTSFFLGTFFGLSDLDLEGSSSLIVL